MKGQPASPRTPATQGRAAARGGASADRIELMQTFVRIVEAGSLSMAAAQLQTTQPTVSRRLQTLERLLGVRLLQRSTHAMKLTEDGERCYGRAKELVADWTMFEADVRGVGHAPAGTLRVVVPHAFGQELLVGPLAGFLQQYPEVSVEWLLHDRTPDFIAEAIDCAIHVGEVHEPGVVAVRLATCRARSLPHRRCLRVSRCHAGRKTWRACHGWHCAPSIGMRSCCRTRRRRRATTSHFSRA